MEKPEIPTSGGSYVRRNGALELVEATQPAPLPENRKSSDDEAPSPAPAEVKEES